VRAAISAGDWILEPMYQAPSAMPPTTPRMAQRIFTRFVTMPYSFQPLTARGPSSRERCVGLRYAMPGRERRLLIAADPWKYGKLMS
jgi:hypothetical protein